MFLSQQNINIYTYYMFNKPRNYNGGKKILINFKKSFSQYNIEEEQS